MSIHWRGSGVDEIGFIKENNSNKIKTIIKVDQRYFRPAEVDELLGDPQKAIKKLGWKSKTNLKDAILKTYETYLNIK